MAPFDECCVLLPASTLEDFPSVASDYDARSLLAAWTVLWHPRLIAQFEQIPTWYRADAPPDPPGRRIITVPSMSPAQLPNQYESRCLNGDCKWVTGASRQEMLQTLALGEDPAPLRARGRTIGVDDFFAAGFAVLQIQVMTRRLRYTSNLDEIQLQTQITSAAKSLLSGDAESAVESMHAVFDALAEERDHYFSSDPHLIDLTLLTGSTLDRWLDTDPFAGLGNGQEDAADLDSNRATAGFLPTPQNVLIDADAAAAISACGIDRTAALRDAVSSGRLGWAGGGPSPDICLDSLTFSQAEAAIEEAFRVTHQAIGSAPPVYARFSGSTPADVTATLTRLGYVGMIPIDFAGGTGFGDESKVIRRAGGAEIESLTAKPIDAASEASFLSIGARLGEAVDSGEIATALLAHWPDQGCDSYHDLRRVASWSLALGRFWKLEAYFRDGEQPYHHANAHAASSDAANHLTQRVQQGTSNVLSEHAAAFRQSIHQEQTSMVGAMAALISGHAIGEGEDPSSAFAIASGAQPSAGDGPSLLLINPHGVAQRQAVSLPGLPPKVGDHVYAASRDAGRGLASIDVPAFGFAVAQSNASPPKRGWLGTMVFGGAKPIADDATLKNEFMEVTISPKSGGISGVYSGGTRGNRFSMRLVCVGQPSADQTEGSQPRGSKNNDAAVMQCGQLRVVSSTPSQGSIAASGSIVDTSGRPLARYRITYTLQRGSRIIQVAGELEPAVTWTAKPWESYLAARVAVASEAAVYRALLRDKIHRAGSRRLVAPLGVLIDEAERQTLVSSAGLAFHRRVDDRFLDTLLSVKGESTREFSLQYGFDVRNPIATAKSMIEQPIQVPIAATTELPPRGWIIHLAPQDIVITRLVVRRREDGLLVAIVRLIQTRSRSCRVALRFCRDVKSGRMIGEAGPSLSDDRLINQPLSDDDQVTGLTCDGDRVSLKMSGHQVADLVVVFSR